MSQATVTSKLLVTVSSPAYDMGATAEIDEKAVSGLTSMQKAWGGPLKAVFRSGTGSKPAFHKLWLKDDLPFELLILNPAEGIPDIHLNDCGILMAGADDHLNLIVADQGRRLGIPVVFTLEYSLTTRMQILRLSEKSLLRKAREFVWQLQTERMRRKAIASAAALQTNGTPVAGKYHPQVEEITFFDTRMREDMLATDKEQRARRARLEADGPLQLVFTGRLEQMKGAGDLVPIAAGLKDAGLKFNLQIFGQGSLSSVIQKQIDTFHLGDLVELHEPVDFETKLVPLLRGRGDVFLCCHRQSDPSCTYLETLGCGIPIVSYDNDAAKGVLERSGGGWLVPIGSIRAMTNQLIELNENRSEIVKKSEAGLAFASEHTFEASTAARVAQLRRMSERACNIRQV